MASKKLVPGLLPEEKRVLRLLSRAKSEFENTSLGFSVFQMQEFNLGIMALANIVSAKVAYRLAPKFWDIEFGEHWWDYTKRRKDA